MDAPILHKVGPTKSFSLTANVGFCNAVRRTLLHDLKSYSPYQVEVRENTSCQTDEFLAHRIGMIPFRRVGNGLEMTLRAEGPASVRASELVGPGFEAVHAPSVEVIRLGRGQSIDLTVRFDCQSSSKHARYCKVQAVGMRPKNGQIELRFSTMDGSDPSVLLSDALDHLDQRVEHALAGLSRQPTTPPQSFC